MSSRKDVVPIAPRNLNGIKVFFGCSMRGGQALVSMDEVRALKDELRKFGLVFVSEHQTESGIIAQEDQLGPTQVRMRDWRLEQEAQVGVFEVSNPSLGVGCEISDMLHMDKPVIALYHTRVGEASISAYIRGIMGSGHFKAPFVCVEYGSLEHARAMVQNFALEFVPELR